jgi:hypothetical protein
LLNLIIQVIANIVLESTTPELKNQGGLAKIYKRYQQFPLKFLKLQIIKKFDLLS